MMMKIIITFLIAAAVVFGAPRVPRFPVLSPPGDVMRAFAPNKTHTEESLIEKRSVIDARIPNTLEEEHGGLYSFI